MIPLLSWRVMTNIDERTADRPLVLGARSFDSRLFVGTGKYATFEQMEEALELAGTQCVTVAVRRVNLDSSAGPSLLDHVDRGRYTILPNTAGCFDAESAVRTARLAREILDTNLVKLEVLGDERTLLPDPVGIRSAREQETIDVGVCGGEPPDLSIRDPAFSARHLRNQAERVCAVSLGEIGFPL